MRGPNITNKKKTLTKYITENFQNTADKEEILKVPKGIKTKQENHHTQKIGVRTGIGHFISTPKDNEALPPQFPK